MSYLNATRVDTAGAFMNWIDQHSFMKSGDQVFIHSGIHAAAAERFIQAKRGIDVTCITTEGWGPTRIANRWFPEIGVQPPL